jgi:transcription termination factor Rho
MSTVLDRDALEASPLADLHLIANQLGVDGFRRLRKAELIDAIVAKQSGDSDVAEAEAEVEVEAEVDQTEPPAAEVAPEAPPEAIPADEAPSEGPTDVRGGSAGEAEEPPDSGNEPAAADEPPAEEAPPTED